MAKVTTNTVNKAKKADSATLSVNVWTSGTRAANAVSSAKDDALAVLCSGKFPLDSKDQIARDLHDFFVENLDNKTLSKVTSKDDGDGCAVYAFRSCNATKVMWQWGTVVSKAVDSGNSFSDIFEMEENALRGGDYKFPTRKQVYDLCKDDKTDLEKFEALMQTAGKIAKKIKGKAEVRRAEGMVSDLLDKLSKK